VKNIKKIIIFCLNLLTPDLFW